MEHEQAIVWGFLRGGNIAVQLQEVVDCREDDDGLALGSDEAKYFNYKEALEQVGIREQPRQYEATDSSSLGKYKLKILRQKQRSAKSSGLPRLKLQLTARWVNFVVVTTMGWGLGKQFAGFGPGDRSADYNVSS
ncbi:hypothetical protein SGCOL_007088 [Colletotrichum sp. CLE4]